MALKMKRVAESIYKRGDVFYERIQFEGRNTFKKLPVATLKEARDYRASRRTLHLKALDGLAPASPYEAPVKPTQSATVADLCQAFLGAGCPDKERQFKGPFSPLAGEPLGVRRGSALAPIPIVGPALGAAAAAAAIAAGLANVSHIQSTKPSGVAHGGLDYVPRESTFLLDEGERLRQGAT